MSLAQNVERVRRDIEELASQPVTLLAVTKTIPAARINELAACGVADYGENRVQEWIQKRDEIETSLRFHMIGQLQTNKIRNLIDHIYMAQSVDRPSLLAGLEDACAKRGRMLDILLEVNLTTDERRGGVMPHALDDIIVKAMDAPHLRLRGLMAVLPAVDEARCREHCRWMRRRFEDMRRADAGVDTLSMGMSGDYRIALSEGSTLIRIGSALWSDPEGRYD